MSPGLRFILITVVALLLGARSVEGQPAASSREDPFWLLPDAAIDIDRQIPPLQQIVGHRFGADVSSHAEIEIYLRALAKAAPFRTRLEKYGETYEGRALWQLVISSPENIERLDEIRAQNLQLCDPRATERSEANRIIERAPAIVWLAYTVHGNESSGTDAAVLTAYHILADTRAATKALLRDVVVIIDPIQNPDGRDRFINAYREMRGRFPQSEPYAAEHTERWPGGRFNHYGFDLNRDWFLGSQVETRTRVAAFLRWMPQVAVDAHEMGRNSSYFFAPPAEPVSDLILPRQREWFDRLGRRQADRFDRLGFSYTTREMFDLFYPGYGESWPTLQGSIGMLWEQAGVRGLVVDRDDGRQLTYQDAVRHHYVSSIVTIESAAAHRKALVADAYETRRDTIRLGREGPVRDFFLLPGRSPGRTRDLVRLLVRNGIEVRRVEQAISTTARGLLDHEDRDVSIPAGSFHVPVAQPAGRLVLALLDRHLDMGREFVAEQLSRVANREPHQIYDLTAWSLPLLYGVSCIVTSTTVEVQSRQLEAKEVEATPAGRVDGGPARVAYLVPSDEDGLASALAEALRRGIRVHVADRSFKLDGRRFSPGTLVVKVAENAPTIHDDVRGLANAHALSVVAANTGYVEDGAHFGGPDVRWVRPPRVAMLVDSPTSSTVGHTWYLFDELLRYPVTPVAARYLSRLDLTKYNVLILPHGRYGSKDGFDGKTATRLREWVASGGTLVCVKGAASWAVSDDIRLLESSIKKVPSAEKDTAKSDGTKPEGEMPDSIPGAILRANVYHDHWATFGAPKKVDLLIRTSRLFEPLAATAGRNLVRFAAREEVLTSGFCWPKTLDLAATSPYLFYRSVGKGHVVAFVDDPNYRVLSPVLQRFFTNVVLFGPGH